MYGDPPPTAVSGTVWYTLTTDAGATTLLELSPDLLASAGGATRLDRTRVSVIIAPARESTSARQRTAHVREIRRETGTSGASC